MELNWIIQPVIGAVIGCFTNYVAIKMLFRPYRERKIFGWTLPFTPGMIPGRRADIARAIGRVVGENLLEKDDIARALTKDSTAAAVRQGIMDYRVNIPAAGEGRESAGTRAADMLLKLDIKNAVSKEISGYIREKVTGNFLGKFIGEKLISEISEQLGEWAQAYLEKDGKLLIGKTIDDEIAELADMRVEDILLRYGADMEEAAAAIENKYREVIFQNYTKVLGEVNIAEMIEEKINAMDIAELEKLLFGLMKKELNAIVYLGALIGFVIGFLGLLA